jgi:hypothetical protein
MAEKQPTFRERRVRISGIAEDLAHFATVLSEEAERMAAAEKRFAARDAIRKPKADR